MDAPQVTDERFYARAIGAFKRMVVVFVRQSTTYQANHHHGSSEVQKNQEKYLAPFAIPPERILRILALGESGAEDRDRKEFERMLALVEEGVIGVIVVARHDRLGRNKEDHVRLMAAMNRRGALLMVDGRLYDPREPNDTFLLDIHASFAEYENKLRTRWMRLTALALARDGKYRINLPAPFAWCSPDDPEYVRQMRGPDAAPELRQWMTAFDERLARQDAEHDRAFTACSRGADGRRYYVLPVPDADALRATQAMIQFLLETRSLSRAVAMTRTDARWPQSHVGEFPVVHSRSFDPEVPVRWVPINRNSLRGWLTTPPVFGRYSYASAALSKHMTEEETKDTRISISNAFQGLANEEDEARIQHALRVSHGKKTVPSGESRHGLPLVVCGHRGPDGQSCGRKLYPVRYRATFRYKNQKCSTAGHGGEAGHIVDDDVLDVLTAVFRREALSHGLVRRRLAGCDTRASVRDLEQTIHQLTGRVQACTSKELDARIASNVTEEDFWRRQRLEFAATLNVETAKLRSLEGDARRLQQASEEDIERILAIGTSFPALLARARKHPVLLRTLVAECVKAVHVHTPGDNAFVVETEFHGGARVTRHIFSAVMHSPQPSCAFAAIGSDLKSPPSEIARVLQLAMAGSWATSTTSWDARRVIGASLLYRHVPEVFERDSSFRMQALMSSVEKSTPPMSVAAIAATRGIPYADVLGAGLRGCFGTAHIGPPVGADGTDHRDEPSSESATVSSDIAARHALDALLFAVDESELETEFPDYARRRTAERAGWEEQDTVSVRVAADRLIMRHTNVLNQLRRAGIPLALDLEGLHYVSWSMVQQRPELQFHVQELERLLEEAPQFAHLPRNGWVLRAAARRRFAGGWDALAPFLPTLTSAARPKGAHRSADVCYVWVDDELLTRCADDSLRQAVTSLSGLAPDGSRFDPRDFVARQSAFALVSEKLEINAFTTYVRAQKAGAHREIAALGRVKRATGTSWTWALVPVLYVWMPRKVRASSSDALWLSWVRGGLPDMRHAVNRDDSALRLMHESSNAGAGGRGARRRVGGLGQTARAS